MKEIMTLGEPMVVYIAEEPGSFQEVGLYSRGLAGAELNFSIGVSRLGHEVTYFTKVGQDPYGAYIKSFIEREGIDGSCMIVDPHNLTGSYLKSKVLSGDPEVFYFRKNSSASHMGPQDIQGLDFGNTRLVHLTGITPALSLSCREACLEAAKMAAAQGAMVTFDPNIREKLWDDPGEMRDTLNEIAFNSDIVLPGIKEGKLLTGTDNPEEIADFYLQGGATAVIVKLGEQGAYYKASILDNESQKKSRIRLTFKKSAGIIPGYQPYKIVDTVGAGDAFAAGVATGLLEGLPLEMAVARGNAMGAIIISSKGDNDNLPNRTALEQFQLSRAVN